jgi:hypothetical protein
MNNTLKNAFLLGNLFLCITINSIPVHAQNSSWEIASANTDRLEDSHIEENQNLDNSSSFKSNNLIDLGGISSYPQDIVPARGMILNEKGQVVLTGYPTPNTPDRPATQLFNCNNLNKN